jgi:hypothetical protein
MKFLRAQWDRAGAVLGVVIGAVMLIVGWVGVSGSGLPAGQIPYVISCGVGGLFILGVAAVLWLSADLRDEWHKLDRIENAIRSADSQAGAAAPSPAAAAAPAEVEAQPAARTTTPRPRKATTAPRKRAARSRTTAS